MKTLFYLQVLIICFFAINVSAQLEEDLQENVVIYNAKINELIKKHTTNGFKILREQKLPIRSNIDMVITLPLYAGDWYHFSFVGDPSADKIKATLYLEGFGDLIQDRIIVRRENEFWTEFSFMCPQSGNYELTLFQKAEISRPLSYLTVFKHE